jgi:hypothetical protein
MQDPIMVTQPEGTYWYSFLLGFANDPVLGARELMTLETLARPW